MMNVKPSEITSEELAALAIAKSLQHLEESRKKGASGDSRGKMNHLYAAAVNAGAAGEILFSALLCEVDFEMKEGA